MLNFVDIRFSFERETIWMQISLLLGFRFIPSLSEHKNNYVKKEALRCEWHYMLYTKKVCRIKEANGNFVLYANRVTWKEMLLVLLIN
jgi:hypothetical protein